MWDRWKEAPAPKKLDSSSRFRTIPACDTRTDRRTHDDRKYRASTASRGKNTCCVRCHDISSVCVCSVCVACNGSDVMRCANTDRCIHTSYVCDGHDTCGDWTDELNCSQSTFPPLSHDTFTHTVHLLTTLHIMVKD